MATGMTEQRVRERGFYDPRPSLHFRHMVAARCLDKPLRGVYVLDQTSFMLPDENRQGFDTIPFIWELLFSIGYTSRNLFRFWDFQPNMPLDVPEWEKRHILMYEVYLKIVQLCPGGIIWATNMQEYEKRMAKAQFMSQFGFFLEACYDTLIWGLKDMEIEYPQFYTAICAFCGGDVFFDFWGLPVRQRTADNKPIFAIHRCDVHNAPYYTTEGEPYNGVLPSVNQRKDLSSIFGYTQKIVVAYVLEWAVMIWHKAENLSNGAWPRGYPEDFCVADLHKYLPNVLQGEFIVMRGTPRYLEWRQFFLLPDADLGNSNNRGWRDRRRMWDATINLEEAGERHIRHWTENQSRDLVHDVRLESPARSSRAMPEGQAPSAPAPAPV